MAAKKTKHEEITEYLGQAIAKGEYQVGDRLPSEHALVAQFSTSRPTVARALRELQHAGVIERRVGSGTFVREMDQGKSRLLFGLLIPELGSTEIFDPICAQVARQIQAAGHSLLWSDYGDASESSTDRIHEAEAACANFIERQVAGVLFAPVEDDRGPRQANERILESLANASIPVVLLDRDVRPFPHRSPYDLVGIDNVRGGYIVADHLIQLGHQRVCFFARPHSAPTVARRIAGYREAMWYHGLSINTTWIHCADPEDATALQTWLRRAKPDAIICANDITAAQLIQTLSDQDVSVPDDVAVAGFDDVKFARLLGVPLTTIAQPCRALGDVASRTLFDRVTETALPARTILLAPSLVVRESSGRQKTTLPMNKTTT